MKEIKLKIKLLKAKDKNEFIKNNEKNKKIFE